MLTLEKLRQKPQPKFMRPLMAASVDIESVDFVKAVISDWRRDLMPADVALGLIGSWTTKQRLVSERRVA